MAQPNVVREPSMDEILASIRRIIESNDPVPGIVNGMPEPEGFSGNAANDDMEDVPLTIDDTFASHQEPLRPAMPDVFASETPRHDVTAQEMSRPAFAAVPREPEAAQQPKSLSLADVAARVRAASERNPGLRDLAPKAEEEEIVPVATEVAAPQTPASSPLMTGRMAAAGGSVQAERYAEPQAERPTVDWNEIAPRAEQRQPVEEQPAVAAKLELETMLAEPVEGEPAAATSLISIGAGQQVAQSFANLAVAIDEAERRSYDDIAADLLRPMLQEWLDENLPTLVERLVREEIERVARGNRR